MFVKTNTHNYGKLQIHGFLINCLNLNHSITYEKLVNLFKNQAVYASDRNKYHSELVTRTTLDVLNWLSNEIYHGNIN